MQLCAKIWIIFNIAQKCIYSLSEECLSKKKKKYRSIARFQKLIFYSEKAILNWKKNEIQENISSLSSAINFSPLQLFVYDSQKRAIGKYIQVV